LDPIQISRKNQDRQIRQKLYEVYHREKPRRNPDIIRTVYLEGRVATIERHREKLDRKTGLSRQIRSRYPTAVRSAKEARTISHRSFGVRDFTMQRTMSMKTPKSRNAKSRYNRDRQIKDEIWTVYLYGHVAARRPYRQFGVRDFTMQRTMSMKTPKSRDAKSRYNRDRQIKDEIWTVYLYGHVAARRPYRQFGVRDFTMQRTMSMKTPKSRDAKSRYNRDRQIKDEIWTVYLYGHVAARRPFRQFGVRDFIMQRTMKTKSPISRYAKSRLTGGTTT
jgi:hypothetical protein